MEDTTSTSEPTPFPWHLQVYDAHCHPTDTMSRLSSIPQMKARALTVMATRAQDQDLVDQAALDLSARSQAELHLDSPQQRSTKIIPSFGWHPWFSHQLFDPSTFPDCSTLTPEQKSQHYRAVLTPPPSEAFIASLPSPLSLTSFLASTKSHLAAHPLALVGEIGLDKGFRLPEAWTHDSSSSSLGNQERDQSLTPGGREGRRLSPHKVTMAHQRVVLGAQLALAGEMGRAASVHGVQAAGLLYDALAASWKGHEREVLGRRRRKMAQREAVAAAAGATEGDDDDDGGEDSAGQREGSKPFPPRICLHSYSGPPETVKQYLHPSTPADIFFSFSTAVNFSGESRKAEEAVKVVPEDRILVESDLHIAGERMDEMLEDIVRRICGLRGWELEQGVRQLGKNWRRFVFG